MVYVLHSPTQGTFIDGVDGRAFFTRIDTAGYHRAVTCTSPEAAELFQTLMRQHVADIQIHKAISGHWSHLKEAGLHIGDMDLNELMNAECLGHA